MLTAADERQDDVKNEIREEMCGNVGQEITELQ